MALIEVRNLVKEFRRPAPVQGPFGGLRRLFRPGFTIHRAVNGLSFSIEEGELVGFLGPNGAGKSTTIKMLAGILMPTSGEISVGGLHPARDRRRHARQIGVLFGQKTQLWWDIPTIESLRTLKAVYGVPDDVWRRNLDLFRELLALHEFEHVPVRQLSLGQRMRADLAAALLHNPKILFLDEPTIGVDVLAKERLRTFIREINRERRVTVLLTTHDMGDIEKLCSRVMIIDHGSLLYDGPTETLKQRFGGRRTLVVYVEEDWNPAALDTFDPDWRAAFAVEKMESQQNRVTFAFDPRRTAVSDLIAAVAERIPVRDLLVEDVPIEEVVRSIYLHSEQLREATTGTSGPPAAGALETG
ncbi:MAG: ATP-binding cassette domain-containing protein [Alicyclobacillaceae bacterium]|nr:ATP-binding cassette domain-containing protein [Alicyclobacillaceae bacterium]